MSENESNSLPLTQSLKAHYFASPDIALYIEEQLKEPSVKNTYKRYAVAANDENGYSQNPVHYDYQTESYTLLVALTIPRYEANKIIQLMEGEIRARELVAIRKEAVQLQAEALEHLAQAKLKQEQAEALEAKLAAK